MSRFPGSLIKTAMLCSLALCSMAIHAQKPIVGIVCDKTGVSPIHMATVVHYQDSAQSKMLAYSITDKKGFFSLASPRREGSCIVVRCVGYRELLVKNIQEGDTLHLRMEEAEVELGEVTVKGLYSGVKARGDSIIFDVGHFKTGSEENVADVLNRLPGVNVSGTGKVSYAGKDISKVLVNGQETMDMGSGVMINGLGADIVSGVQVLNNWKDGSLKEEFNDISRTALNIETKKGVNIAGTVEGGGGILNKYELKPTVMLNSGNFSLTAAASSNNYGNEVFSIEEYISGFVDLSSILGNGGGKMVLSEAESQMLVPPQNVYRNSNSAAVANGVYKPSETLTVKSSVLYSHSKMNSLEENSNYYYMADLTSFEKDEQETANDMFSANINARWNPSRNFELSSATLGSYSDYGRGTDIEVSLPNGKGLNAYRDKAQKKRQISESLSASLKAGDNGLFFANASFAANSSKSSLDILSDSLLIPAKSAYDGSLYAYGSYVEAPSISFAGELGYSHKIKKNHTLRISAAYEREAEDMQSYGIADAPLEDEYNTSRYNVAARLSKQKGFLRYNIGGSVVWNSCEYAGTKERKANLCPDLMLRLVFSPKQELALTGKRSVSAVPHERFLTYALPLDYNSYRAASQMKSPLATNDQLILHYRIMDLYYNFLLFVNGRYSRDKGRGIDKITQDGILSFHTYIDGGDTKNTSLSATVRKGLGNRPIDAQLYTSFSLAQMPFMTGDALSEYKMKFLASSLTFSTRYLSAINAEIKGSYEKTRTRTSSLYETESNEYSLSGKLLFAKNKWKGEMRYSYDVITGDLNNHSNHNLGFRVSYNMRHLYFRLSGNNLLRIRNYEWAETNISTTYQSQTQYLRMPGHLLATIGWRL